MWITALPPSLDFSIREIVVSESVDLDLCYVRIEIPVLEAKLLTKPVPKELRTLTSNAEGFRVNLL